MKRSVELAVETRDAFWNCKTELEDFQPPLVAASIGSYGAYLADGSEYRYIHSPSINALTNIEYIQFLSVVIYCYSGNYGPEMTLEKLKDFHRRRIQLLAEAGPDLLAFETTPNKLEAQVSFSSHDSLCYSGYVMNPYNRCSFNFQAYIELIKEEKIGIPSWISFNSKDGVNVVSGDSFQECVELVDSCPGIIALGINCTPPRFINGLILSARKVIENLQRDHSLLLM